MLFGLSFYIQLKSAESKQDNFLVVFLWKMVLLVAFGLLHRIIFQGDILITYGLLGMLLVLFWKVNSTTLFVTTTIMMLGGGRVIIFFITQGEPLFPEPSVDVNGIWLDAIVHGGFWDINQVYWEKLTGYVNSQINVDWARSYITFAYFFFGIMIGRSGWLHDVKGSIKTLHNVFVASFSSSIIFLALHLKYVVFASYSVFMHDYTTVESLVKFSIFDMFAFSMSVLYLCCCLIDLAA